jgi:hypothetical protein
LKKPTAASTAILVASHVLKGLYGTWMTRYGELDTYGLTRTGRWKDPDSADRYNHTIASPEARRADQMPGAKIRGKSVELPHKKGKHA